MTTAPALAAKGSVMRPVRRPNAEYRVREHLTETEIEKLLAALKRNRHGPRDWLIGLMIYRHGLRSARLAICGGMILISRADNRHQTAEGIKGQHSLPRTKRTRRATPIAAQGGVCLCQRARPTVRRMGIARLIERAGEAAGLPFPVHVHMLRHSCGYALANKGMDTRRLQHYLGHASISRLAAWKKEQTRLRSKLASPKPTFTEKTSTSLPSIVLSKGRVLINASVKEPSKCTRWVSPSLIRSPAG